MEYAERESLLLAPYAMHAADSAGRGSAEADHPYRSPYQRDRDRITHSSAYRRLSHKTQVFTGDLGDYHRTRLTHTLEVASIARTIARALRLNEDLVEALALAHDVGHPPFGHAGEDYLNERLAGHGGFNHNRQALRIFQKLEQRYVDRRGLNLTMEVLEGQRLRADKHLSADDSRGSPLLEVQVVDAADSIAYDAHDADDALELGLLTMDELSEAGLWNESLESVRRRYQPGTAEELRRATVHELIDRQVSDLLAQVQSGIRGHGIDSIEAVRAAPPLARHSEPFENRKRELESLLFRRVYRHALVLEHREEAVSALGAKFDEVLGSLDRLPALYRAVAEAESPERAVADFASGLTDRAVLEPWRAGRA